MRNYGEAFEKLWKVFGSCQKSGLGNRGSKPRAAKEFGKICKEDNIDPEHLYLKIGRIVAEQAQEKLRLRRSGEFAEQFQHVERYLRNRRWEDNEEIGESSLPIAEPTEDELIQEKIAQLFDTSWARHLM